MDITEMNSKYTIYTMAKHTLENARNNLVNIRSQAELLDKDLSLDNVNRLHIQVIRALHNLCKLYTLDQTPHEFDDEIIDEFSLHNNDEEYKEIMTEYFKDDTWDKMKSVASI